LNYKKEPSANDTTTLCVINYISEITNIIKCYFKSNYFSNFKYKEISWVGIGKDFAI